MLELVIELRLAILFAKTLSGYHLPRAHPRHSHKKMIPPGMVHAGVGQNVLKCNEFKTLFAEWPISQSRASLTLLQVTADLPLHNSGVAASAGHATIVS